MGKGYIDKRMGGRFRDKDVASINVDAGGVTQQYIQDLINNSTFDWSQITGSVTNNQELKSYINDLLDLFALNQFNIGDELTQEMLNYFQSIFDQLTITRDQITDLDTVNADFKTYIDNLVSELNTKIETLVLGDSYTEELKNYIDNSISNLQTVLEQLIQNTINTSIQQLVEEINNQSGESTRLISGTVTWLQNLDFFVSPLVYQILNQRIESAERNLTIPANVSNDPMFALIVGDVFGNISYLQGVSAPAPSIPLINSSTQIIIQTVYIPALGTEPGNDPGGETTDIVTETIYDENIEWATSKTEEANLTIDFEAVADPKKGAKHISMAIIGGAAIAERSTLIAASAKANERLVGVGADPIDFSISVSDIFPDHKTNFLVNHIRHLVFYDFKGLYGIKAYLFSPSTNQSFQLIAYDYTDESFEVPELGFSVGIPETIHFNFKHLPEPGDYILRITSGFSRNDQQYIVTGATSLLPQAAAISFTRAEALEAKDGKISLSLKTDTPWLNNTGLLFELYNGAIKTGSLAMLPANYRGYNPSNTEYQRITLPVADFNPADTQITRLVMRPVNQWPVNSVLKLDDVSIQTGLETIKVIDKYVESVSLDETGKQTFKRTGGLKDLTVQFGTMAAKGFWTGTAAAYAAIGAKDANTIYLVEE